MKLDLTHYPVAGCYDGLHCHRLLCPFKMAIVTLCNDCPTRCVFNQLTLFVVSQLLLLQDAQPLTRQVAEHCSVHCLLLPIPPSSQCHQHDLQGNLAVSRSINIQFFIILISTSVVQVMR